MGKIIRQVLVFYKNIFVCYAMFISAYGYGTFKPNKWAKEKVNDDRRKFLSSKSKADLDLREPVFDI